MYVHLSALDLNESSDFFHVLALHSESDGDRWALFIGVGWNSKQIRFRVEWQKHLTVHQVLVGVDPMWSVISVL